ncbi:MAG: alanine--tRNA ligase [Bacteroidetes bacterium]|nr:alanine--tRNA ligase [Bacteroidota bacterium]
MTSNEIRKAFLDFFESKGHKIVPSAPIVVKNDPTLMFINSGMAPFKDIFLGNQPIKYPRVADTQKCLRVSGKHNDLEEVGVDTYHHTMFEMLGNWSFGDYFKKDAIAWSWQLLTEVYGLDKDRLYVTVFEGDAKENLAFDQESYDYWKAHTSEDRILRGNKKDNFWEMGDTGPCGPCSEIHIDLRSEEERKAVKGADLVNSDNPKVIEIWNNVFMEFERKADKSLVKLPKQHVDTGMGFERLCVAVQGKANNYSKTSNYDTDIFQGSIQQLASKSGIEYKATMPASLHLIKDSERTDIAMRVIADHIRAISFTIADGQLPSNTGAGYVIRRILRRAVRYGYSYLGFETPFLCELVPGLADKFADVFPELKAQQDFVTNVIREEETSFLRTLANGIRKFAAIEEELKKSNGTVVEGKVAFELFDTYGFPLDLTRLLATEKGFSIDEAGFNEAMKKQKALGKADAATEQSDWVTVGEDVKTDFIGYDYNEADAHVVKYRSVKQKDKELYQLVLDKTPFYAESGGQVGDTGYLDFGGEKIDVLDTKKENDLIVHFVKQLPKQVDATAHAKINEGRRADTVKNHSATHLLQSALRQVLGTHVQQKGSLVNSDYLRFDFSHFSKMTDEEIAQVERIVNEKIMENISLDERRNVPIADAEKLGATMLFGEKYGEFVRVITFDEKFSRELCGGTHAKSTGEIGLFKIISEGSVAAGVRRIEAVTGKNALQYVDAKLTELNTIAASFKGAKSVSQAVLSLQEQAETLRKENEQLQDKIVAGLAKQLKTESERLVNNHFIAKTGVEVTSADALRKLGILLVNDLKDNFVILLSAHINDKYIVHLRIAPGLGINGNALLKELAPNVKGGGPADFVQASAANGNEVEELCKKLHEKFNS